MVRPLEKKVAIVTGANQGLGLEISQKYLEAGASLALCARNGTLLKEVRGRLMKGLAPGQEILAMTVDVSKSADVLAFVNASVEKFGHLDILVNNAGVYGPKGPIEDVDWSEWVQAIEINLYGSILMCRAVLPHFKKQGHGKIVQLSGGGGHQSFAQHQCLRGI